MNNIPKDTQKQRWVESFKEELRGEHGFGNNECSSRAHVFYIKNIHLVASQVFHSNHQMALGVRKATTPKDPCQYGEENL